MNDFAAIDFETANGQRSSVCSVGVVVVRGGELASWDGMEVHVYGFAIGAKDSRNPGKASATGYCGSGEVA